MPKQVLVILGDFYHPATPFRKAFFEAVKPLADAGEIQFIDTDVQGLSEALLQKPDGVILYKEDRVRPQEDDSTWMDALIGRDIASYVRQGGGWLAWHCGMASYAPDGSYVDMLRGYFLSHPRENQMVRYVPEHQQEVLPSLDSFELLDEHYFVECDTQHTNVFLRSHSVDGDSIAGWAHEYGDGRVCCLTPAHHPAAFENPGFRDSVIQSIEWITRRHQ